VPADHPVDGPAFRPAEPHGFRAQADVPADRPAEPFAPAEARRADGGTGHPAVDAVLQSLANAARLAPADQIAEYEAAHRVLQETLTSIDG
jgi:hypothetical protein